VSRIRTGFATIGVVAACASLAGPAGAQEAKPQPTQCAGVTLTDAKGDHPVREPVLGAIATPQKHTDNFDIHRVFFRNTGGQLTANIQVAKLDKSKFQGSDATAYWLYYTFGEELRFAVAWTDGTNWFFKFGHDEDGFVFDGETTGKAHEGADGIVEIVMPEDVQGETLSGLYARSAYMVLAKNDPIFGADPLFYNVVDSAPDDETAGPSYTATPCAETGVPTPAATQDTTPAKVDAPPASSEAANSGAQQAAPAPAAAPAPFTVTVPKLTAAKLKKGKRFAVSVKAAAPVKGLKVTLMKGSRAVATGTLKSLSGTKQVRLKVSRKLAKGSYRLLVKGTDASGKAVSGTVAVVVA
jgi:hypothetical protein